MTTRNQTELDLSSCDGRLGLRRTRYCGRTWSARAEATWEWEREATLILWSLVRRDSQSGKTADDSKNALFQDTGMAFTLGRFNNFSNELLVWSVGRLLYIL
jgi:hypothetical protein